MATHDKDMGGKFELSRRDFVKAGAAAAAVGAVGVDFAVCPSRADAAQVARTAVTTCTYCSAQCGQIVAVDASNKVIDIYGDMNSPTSRGGLCSKGAAALQLVNNPRRLGVPEHTALVDGFDFTGRAWKRTGNGAWTEMALDTAMTEIAGGLKGIRGTVTPGSTGASNAKTVQFFGSSHMNCEGNYLYRKIIANFGTSLVEHQARI